MYSGQRRSAGSAQVSGEQVPEMDGSMALMATEEGAWYMYIIRYPVTRTPNHRNFYLYI